MQTFEWTPPVYPASFDWIGPVPAAQMAAPTGLATQVAAIIGPRGLPGGEPVVFTQAVPALLWSVSHNLGRVPPVLLKTLGSAEIEGQIDHLSDNQFIVSFNSPQAGQAIYS